MMDIVERMQSIKWTVGGEVFKEAAAEIERLRRELDKVREENKRLQAALSDKQRHDDGERPHD